MQAQQLSECLLRFVGLGFGSDRGRRFAGGGGRGVSYTMDFVATLDCSTYLKLRYKKFTTPHSPRGLDSLIPFWPSKFRHRFVYSIQTLLGHVFIYCPLYVVLVLVLVLSISFIIHIYPRALTLQLHAPAEITQQVLSVKSCICCTRPNGWIIPISWTFARIYVCVWTRLISCWSMYITSGESTNEDENTIHGLG